MINLSGKFRYFLCTDNVTLRFRHRGLREYIKSKLHRDPCNGDVYIFLSRDLSRLRIYYFHHNGEILTEKILHAHRFTHPVFWMRANMCTTSRGLASYICLKVSSERKEMSISMRKMVKKSQVRNSQI